MTKIPLASMKRSVVFASVSDAGEVAVINDSTAKQRIYPSVAEFNKVRYRLVVASTEHAAKCLQTQYHVFPILTSPFPGHVIVFATPTDFSFAVLKTGIATALEETLATKHAALRFNSINVL